MRRVALCWAVTKLYLMSPPRQQEVRTYGMLVTFLIWLNSIPLFHGWPHPWSWVSFFFGTLVWGFYLWRFWRWGR